MGGKNFWTGVISGAVLGGLISLSNKDARNYAKNLANNTAERVVYFTKNPAELVGNLKQTVQLIDEKVSENRESAFNAIEQVDKTINKISKR